jgi:hypothetical protein
MTRQPGRSACAQRLRDRLDPWLDNLPGVAFNNDVVP